MRVSEMTTEELGAILAAQGWTVDGDEATLSIDASKEIISGDMVNVFPEYAGYSEIFTDEIHMDYRLDLSSRIASFEVYCGPKTGSEIDEEDHFEGTVEMEVTFVGGVPVEDAVRSDNRMRYSWTDLVRVTRDYANDLYEVEAGEYLIRSFPNVNVEPGQATTYYRISAGEGASILVLAEEDVDDAVAAMEDLANIAEEEGQR